MTNKFIKVRCNKCKNEQVIFEKATTLVKCTSCNAELSKPSGGKAKIQAKLLEVLK